METEASLPHSQVPSICPHPEPARSSPCLHIQLPEHDDYDYDDDDDNNNNNNNNAFFLSHIYLTDGSFPFSSFVFQATKSKVNWTALLPERYKIFWDELVKKFKPVRMKIRLEKSISFSSSRWNYCITFGCIVGKHRLLKFLLISGYMILLKVCQTAWRWREEAYPQSKQLVGNYTR